MNPTCIEMARVHPGSQRSFPCSVGFQWCHFLFTPFSFGCDYVKTTAQNDRKILTEIDGVKQVSISPSSFFKIQTGYILDYKTKSNGQKYHKYVLFFIDFILFWG